MYWIGTYSARGSGFCPIIARDRTLHLGEPEPAIANASFAVWSPGHRIAYVVNETEQGRIAAWKRTHGSWALIGEVSSGGASPCYLSLSPEGRCLSVANYADGALSIVPIDSHTGAVCELSDRYRPEARLKDADADLERQDGPHAHCAIFADDGQTFYHVDLSLDRVFRHRLEGGRITFSDIAFETPRGFGPRHLLFHPDNVLAVLLCELAAALFLLRREGGVLTFLDCVSTSPEPCADGNLGGHIAIAGDGAVLVSNRGHDSIVRFRVVEGRLAMSGWWLTGSSSPRHFVANGDAALVAHEQGGMVTRVALSEPGGAMERIEVPGAAFVLATSNRP